MENSLQLTLTAAVVNSKPIFLGFNSVTQDIKNAYLQESLWQSWHIQPFCKRGQRSVTQLVNSQVYEVKLREKSGQDNWNKNDLFGSLFGVHLIGRLKKKQT